MNSMNIMVVNNGESVLVNGKKAKLLKNDSRCMSRKRFKYENLMIKIDEDLNICDQQSTQELKKWKEISDEDRKFFQEPVYGEPSSIGKRGFIVQEIIKFKRGRKSYELCSFMKKLARKYNINDVETGGSRNWGINILGIPKIYDWGI